VRLGVVGPQRDGALVFDHRLVEAPILRQRGGKVVVRLRAVRPQLNGALIAGGGLVQSPEAKEQRAEVGLLVVVRLRPERFRTQ
jgi:hypothetical protein